MKKKILSLISAVSLMFSMAAFNAVSAAEIADEGFTFVYDAENSTKSKAAFDLYVAEIDSITSFMFKIQLDTNIFDVKDTTNTTGTKIYTDYMGNVNVNKNNGILQFTLANTAGDTSWDPAAPIAKYTLAIKEAYQGKKIDFNDFNVTTSTYKVYGDSTAYTLPYVLPVIPEEKVEPTVETVAATSVALAAPGENEVAGTDVAAAYKASYTFVSGQTAAWTADGKADLAIDLANISGATDLGLVVTGGTVNNVALKVTTPAN